MAVPCSSYSRRIVSAPPRPKQRVTAWTCWGSQNAEGRLDNGVLSELIMKHGRQLEKFPLPLATCPGFQFKSDRSNLSNAWYCSNKAFRQMYCTSARTPRRRTFHSAVNMSPDSTRGLQQIATSIQRESPPKLTKRTRSAPPTRLHRVPQSLTSETIYAVP